MGTPLRVLIIGDSQEEARALVRELEQGGFEPAPERVETAAAVRSAVREKTWDIILCSERVPGLNCLEALELLKETGADIPFIIVSRTIGEEMALDAMKAGARDCIRSRRQRMASAIERELRDKAARRERRQVEEELLRSRESAERLADEMAVIAEIGRLIGSTLNIEDVYDGFAAEAKKLIPFDRIVVNLNRYGKNQRYCAYASGVHIPGREAGDASSLTGSVNALLTAKRSGVILHPQEIAEIEGRYPSLVPTFRAGLRSMMSVPLISRDEVIGGLHFRTKKPNAYTERDLRLAERIGEQIAGAVANAGLFADLKKTEMLLRESEAWFRAIFEQAAVGVAEFDIESGRFLAVNHRLCELVGMTEAEMRASTFHALMHPEDRPAYRDEVALLEAGKVRNLTSEKRYLRKDGEIIWVSVTVSPLRKTGEGSGSNLAVIQDIGERIRVQAQNERHAKQLADLHETSIELTSELNLNTLLRSIATRALNLIGGIYCNCYLYRPEADLMERVATAGKELYPHDDTRRLRGEGLVGRVWDQCVPLLVDDYCAWPFRNKRYDAYSHPSRTIVGAPICWGDEFLGVLSVAAYLPHRFSQADSGVLGMFATQAAIAIRNARLYGKIEQLAVQDELTDLLNRRGFFQLGEREFEGSLRFNRPLAALMFDIDHFKKVNDTHGHAAGDRVLRMLADCFRRNTRGIDVAGRYGGEEFALLMPETLLPGAVQIADRLRQSIAELSIPIRQDAVDPPSVEIRVTVSIGVTVMSPEVPTLEALLERTDQALYRAKHAGRNRVAVWEKSVC